MPEILPTFHRPRNMLLPPITHSFQLKTDTTFRSFGRSLPREGNAIVFVLLSTLAGLLRSFVRSKRSAELGGEFGEKQVI